MKFTSLVTLALLLTIHALQAQTLRVIAESDFIFTGTGFAHTDSTSYLYTGNRGGTALSDAGIQFTTSTAYQYDTAAKTFGNNALVQQSFDGNNNITTQVTQQWDTTTKAWVNAYKRQSMFDALNNDTLDVFQVWNPVKVQWILNTQWHTYFTGQMETSQVGQLYDTTANKFIYVTQSTDTRNAGGYVTKDVDQNWNPVTSKWYNTGQRLWYFQGLVEDTGFLDQGYDTTLQVWTNNFKGKTTFNPDSTTNNSFFSFWNSGTSGWDSTELDTYYYDGRKNDTAVTTQYYSAGQWGNSNLQTTAFNADNQVTAFTQYNWGSTAYVATTKDLFFYELYATGIKDVAASADNLMVYPNPAYNVAYVSAVFPLDQPVQLTVYNLQGQQVWSLNMGTAKRIEAMVPVNSLAAGMYIVTVKQGNTLLQKNMVVGK